MKANKRTAKLLHDACEQDRRDESDKARKLAAHDGLIAALKEIADYPYMGEPALMLVSRFQRIASAAISKATAV
jgi:hypothetical protein